MAQSRIVTLLPLDSWAAIMQLNPYEFNQIADGFPTPNMAQCPYVWFSYAYHQDFLCRDVVAQAIAKAESMLANQLYYWPAPKYFVEEPHKYPQPYNREQYGAGGTARGQWKPIKLNWGKVQGGGLLARTVINLAGAVVLADLDLDLVKETFTVTVLTSVPADEIGIYFTATDRMNAPVDESWRIRPVQVTSAAGVATITGHLWQLVKPALTAITNPSILNVTTATNFVTTVEVYRVYRDTTATLANPAQGSASWEAPLDCGTTPCEAPWVPLCQGNRNAELGEIAVDYYLNGLNSLPAASEPDRVSLNYLAGEPLVDQQMNPVMADAVAHLATALLPVTKCGCEESARILAYWRAIEAYESQGAVPYVPNRFGPRRGAVYAWERVQELALGWAFSA